MFGGPWETVAALESYPDTPEGKAPAIADFARFEQKLAEP